MPPHDTHSKYKLLLHPGLGLKRWLIPLLIGLVIIGLGIGLFLRDLYAAIGYPPFVQILLLQDLPRPLRALIFGSVGLLFTAYSIYQLNKTLLSAFVPTEATVTDIAKQVYRHRHRPRGGPKVVVIGGGTGLSVLLTGLKHHTEQITAIVTVADDGGSSGKLRRELGMLPPGDFRNCIAALADDDSLITHLFQYRFRSGEGLEGHSFGNLFITVMAEITGSFEQALYESGRVLNIQGTILPSTLENVTLFGELDEGATTRKVEGESAIPSANLPIERVYFEPDAPAAFPPAIQAILNADLIVAGPGSLYTSIIPNLLVTDLVRAIEAVDVPKIYICNVATQPGETDGYTVEDHMQAINAHALPNHGRSLFEHVLFNANTDTAELARKSLKPVILREDNHADYQIVQADVVENARPWRHDSFKLANQLIDWYKKYRKNQGA